jgi:glutathione S-transferase
MKHGDFMLADSTAIATYLDALQPEPALYPAEPKARGRAVFFEEFADTVLAAAGGKVVFNRVVKPRLMKVACDEDAVSQGLAELVPLMAWLEGVVPETGWLVEGEFSIADIAVGSVFTTLAYGGVVIDATTHPRSAAWLARVQARAAWQAVAAREAEAMKGFV